MQILPAMLNSFKYFQSCYRKFRSKTNLALLSLVDTKVQSRLLWIILFEDRLSIVIFSRYLG